MPCLLLITTLLFIRGEMKIWLNIKEVSKYYENDYNFVISLFFIFISVLRLLQSYSG